MEPVIGLENYPSFRGINEHEGLATADIDGDGLTDVVGGGRWFKHKGNGIYEARMIEAGYIFTRCAAGQLIEGGRPEIIMSAGDGYGPMNLYQWEEKYDDWNKKWTGTGTWICTPIIETLYDGHTLDILDFNGDGHLDIYTAEMRLDPKNPGTIRILLGDGKGNFKHLVVAEDIGNHEGKIADVDGDGDYDVVSKPYNWDAPRLDVFINNTDK